MARTTSVAVAMLLLTGACGPSQPAAAPAAMPTADETIRKQEEEDRQKRDAEVARRKQRSDEKATADGNADKTKADADEKRCSDTRKDRVAEAKSVIQKHAEWAKTNKARLKFFADHCKAFDPRTVGQPGRYSDGAGTPVDVKCDGAAGRPAGIDAPWYIEMRSMTDPALNGDPVVEGLSATCATSDQAALGTRLNVPLHDADGMRAIVALP